MRVGDVTVLQRPKPVVEEPAGEEFSRRAVCPKPQHVASQTRVEIIPVVAHSSTRCELGQLALRFQ